MALPALGWIIFQVSLRGMPILYEAVVGGSVVAGGGAVALRGSTATARVLREGARNRSAALSLGPKASSNGRTTARLTEMYEHGDISLLHRAGDAAEVSAVMGRFADEQLARQAADAVSRHGGYGYLLRTDGSGRVRFVREIGAGSPHGLDDAVETATRMMATTTRAHRGNGQSLAVLRRPDAFRRPTDTEITEIERYLASVGG